MSPWFSKETLDLGLELLRNEQIRHFHCLRNGVGATVGDNALMTMQFKPHTRLHQGFTIPAKHCSLCRHAASRDGCRHLAALAILSLVTTAASNKPAPLPLAFAGSLWEKLGHFLYDWMKSGKYESKWIADNASLHWQAIRQDGSLEVTIPPAWQQQAAALLPGTPPEHVTTPGRIFELLRNEMNNLAMTQGERALKDAGSTSIGWTRDTSCWLWLARMLHCIHGNKPPIFRHLPDTFLFELSLSPTEVGGEVSIIVPGARAWSLVRQFDFDCRDATVLAAGRECFRAGFNDSHDLEITPCLRLEDGTVLVRQDLARTRFSGGYYLAGEGFLPVERMPREGVFSHPEQGDTLPLLGFLRDETEKDLPMTIPFEEVPAFLQNNQSAVRHAENIIAPEIQNIELHPLPDRLEIDDFEERDGWCYLSCRYGLGNTSIRLEDILAAQKLGLSCLPGDGWLQIDDTPLTWLHDRIENRMVDDGSGRIRLRYHELLALGSIIGNIDVADEQQQFREKIISIVDGSSWTDPTPLSAPPTHLRGYQRNGLAWLIRLHAMGIGGLLADDMGLGKTHQALALLQAAKKHGEGTASLVVCPASVVLGWAEKIDRFYGDLDYTVYYGAGRNLDVNTGSKDLILTTYGVVRRDIDILKEHAFNIVILDEIQHLKNRHTASHRAVAALNSKMVVGLTGTPIENSLVDLYALFKLCLPGLFGSERRFRDCYVQPISNGSKETGEVLARLVRPFVLRRTRSQVLTELPDIIDDTRLCQLSDEQVALYRQVVDERESVIESLQDESADIPYMNILAMITRLKQICNHPCLIKGSTDYEQYSSGKWELFVELVEEMIDAGMKFVVFSQYTTMLAIIENYLESKKIEYCRLTGSMTTQSRQKMITRFNEVPTCRVFVASLLAGGVGIDLTSAQAVIHYDRWWNPAREEQATARVHRMGQKHVVQSFKLITRGTLEEKIHRLIEGKKELAETVIREDEASIIKRLDRQELTELLQL